MSLIPSIHLTPPLLSSAHIARKISCIRGHRERIFNVSVQEKAGKFIFHNYGQGGAGWTFLFGCVHESLRHFKTLCQEKKSLKKEPIIVVGAGCYGLLTAIILARAGHEVKIIAEELDMPASINAAGFFFPRWRKCSTQEEKELFLSRGIESYMHYLSIAQGTHAFFSRGARILPAYYDLSIDPGFSPYIERNLIQQPRKVKITFNSKTMHTLQEYQIIFIDTYALMQELHRLITQYAISIHKKKVASFEELHEKIIFNCTGLGAKELTGDPKIVPVQGHLIALQQQPIDSLQYLLNVKVVQNTLGGSVRDELIYFAPKHEGILGITFLRGQSNPEANNHEFERILERCQSFFGM